MLTVLERRADEVVARGAALLDRVAPGWLNKVDFDPCVFDMGHAEGCVLGQLYGNYWDAYDFFKATEEGWEASDHGFYPFAEWEASDHGFAEVTTMLLAGAWRRLAERRARQLMMEVA